MQSCPQTQQHCRSKHSVACPSGQPGHCIETRPPSNYVVRARCGFPPILRMDSWQRGDNGFHLCLMEMVPPCQCSSRQIVCHLCPSNVALLWAAQAVCPIGRQSNARRNQLRLCACLATNKNRRGHSIACPVMPKGIMYVHQQLCTGHEWGYIHPTLGQAGRGWE